MNKIIPIVFLCICLACSVKNSEIHDTKKQTINNTDNSKPKESYLLECNGLTYEQIIKKFPQFEKEIKNITGDNYETIIKPIIESNDQFVITIEDLVLTGGGVIAGENPLQTYIEIFIPEDNFCVGYSDNMQTRSFMSNPKGTIPAQFQIWMDERKDNGASNFKLVEESINLKIPSRKYPCKVRYSIQSNEGVKLSLPAEVENTLNCPRVLQLSSNGNFLVYLSNQELKIIDLNKMKISKILDISSSEGISNPLWTSNENRFVIAVINENIYKYKTQLIVVDLNEDASLKKIVRYDVPMEYLCGEYCTSSPGDDFRLEDNESIIAYKINTSLDNLEGDFGKLKIE